MKDNSYSTNKYTWGKGNPSLINLAMLEFDFNEPLNEEPDGTYITIGQMQFFLNRKNGKRLFKAGSSEFLEYYNLCRVYNLVSELMEDDPDSAIMYWDPKKDIVSMGFPSKGTVALALSGMEPSVMELMDDDDEEWGDGLNHNG